jgi:hypothetical protein
MQVIGPTSAAFCVLLAALAHFPQEPCLAAPHDPVIDRADVVHDAGPGLTPSLVLTANGDLVTGWDTGGGDGMPNGTVQFARSANLGRTWEPAATIMKTDRPLTGLGASLFRLPGDAGRLLCYTVEVVWPAAPDPAKANYEALAGGRKFDSYYAFSTDHGRTFSAKQLLSDPVRRDDFSQGNIVLLANGDLLWPWGYWGPTPLNGFRRSTDGGLHWGPVARAWQDPPPGHDKPISFNETGAAVCPDGTIVAIARVDSIRDKKFWQIRSTDQGRTWSAPRQIEVAGGSPAMYCTPRGQLWLAYRDAGIGPGLALAVSDDRGETWRFLYHLKDPKGELEKRFGRTRYSDEDRRQAWRPSEGVVGYPCFARISASHVYVVFHLQTWSNRPAGGVPFYIAGNLLRIPD